jgi:FkbM family methyltransferase
MNVFRDGLRNVDIRRAAVGNHDGETTLRLGVDSVYHTTASTSDLLAITAAHETGEQVRVPLIRLDTLREELGTPSIDLIRIDVEGTELDVLQGSVRLLRKERPWLMLEREHFERSRDIFVRWTTRPSSRVASSWQTSSSRHADYP